MSAAWQEEPNTRSGTSRDQADALEGQVAPNTEEGHGDGDGASDSTVVTSSGTAKVEGSCQEVRGPAVLKESDPNTSEMQCTDIMQTDSTLKKSLDSKQETPDDQQQQEDENVVVECRQGSSCDSAATDTLSGGATVDTNSSSNEPQQKQQETPGPQGVVSNEEDKRTAKVSYM